MPSCDSPQPEMCGCEVHCGCNGTCSTHQANQENDRKWLSESRKDTDLSIHRANVMIGLGLAGIIAAIILFFLR